MKKQLITALTGIAFASTAFAEKPANVTQSNASNQPELSDAEALKAASFFFGFQMGSQLGGNGLTEADLNQDSFFEGLSLGLKGDRPDLKDEDLQAIFGKLQTIIEARDRKIGEENLKKEAVFLAENAKKQGVKTTESGLQYEILKQGDGKVYEAPKDAPNGVDMQTEFLINYKGTLIDGTEFDASPENEPAAFTLQVVPGFAEALKLMPVGSKWKIYLPSKLAYGPQRRGAKIGPNETLIFEVELTGTGKRPLPPQGGAPFQLPPGVIPGQ